MKVRGATIINFGKHPGKTCLEACGNEDYRLWFVSNHQGKEPRAHRDFGRFFVDNLYLERSLLTSLPKRRLTVSSS